jgi:outer membrane protein TolC
MISVRVCSAIALGFWLACFSGGAPVAFAAGGSVSNQVVDLKLNDYLQAVLQHNQTLQAQMFGAESSRRKAKGEYGAFEPQLALSYAREANRRTNSVEQQAQQGGQAFFDERNNIYDTALETLLPSGGKVRLGYTLSDLDNNVNPYGNIFTQTNNVYTKQYQTFVGASFRQPLLKGGGFGATLAQLRLAAADSEIGFQQYRRQLMLTVAQAENAYWTLYFTQEQLGFYDRSVAVAQGVLADSQQKVKAGRGAELDVMEARSGLALRQTKRNEALQNYYDAVNNLQSLAGISPAPILAGPDEPGFRAVDAPPETNAVMPYTDGFASALSHNPDFLIQKQKLRQEELKLGVARNELLPELDFKAAYGYNGLGATPADSWDVAQSQDFPSWSVGLELTIPLGGNIKGRNNLSSAKMSLRQAYSALTGTQIEIANRLKSAIRKTTAWHDSIQSYQMVVQYSEELLQTDVARLKAGVVEGRKVLEVEADLLDARQNLVNALVQYQQSELQVELASGTLLSSRDLDVTREQLKQETAGLVRQRQAEVSHLSN